MRTARYSFLLILAHLSLSLDAQTAVTFRMNCHDDSNEENCSRILRYTLLSAQLKAPTYVFNINPVDSVATDYLVSVDLKFYPKEFMINARIAQESAPLPVDFGSATEIQSKIDNSLDEILTRIRSLESSKKDLKRVGIIPHAQNKSIVEIVRNISKDLTIKLLSYGVFNAVNIENYYFTELSPEQILTNEKLDALLVISFEYDSYGRLIGVPFLYFRDVPKIGLLKIVVDQKKGDLNDDFAALFDYLIDKSGSWNESNLKTLRKELRQGNNVLERATDYFIQGNLIMASILATKHLEKNTEDTQTMLLLTKIRIAQKRYPEAKYLLSQVSVKNDEVSFIQGYLNYAGGNYFDAYIDFKSLLRENPTYTESTFGSVKEHFGLTLLELDSGNQAIDIFRQLVSENPTETKYKYQLGKSYFVDTNYKDAIKLLRQIDTSYLNTKYMLSDSHYNMGDKNLELRNYEDALRDFFLANQLHKSEPTTQKLVQVFNRLGRLKESDSMINANARNFHNLLYLQASDLLGIYNNQRRANDPAIKKEYLTYSRKYINNYLEAKPQDKAGIWLSGSVAMSESDFETALKAFAKASELDPKSIGNKLDLLEATILNEQYAEAEKLSDYLLPRVEKSRNKRNLILCLYLGAVVQIIQEDAGKVKEGMSRSTLEVLARNLKGHQPLNWYFDSFKYWLSTKKFNKPETHSRIEELTMKLESANAF